MSQMEFWGAEVKSGESLEVDPGHGVVLHLSQACMGEVKKDKVIERICLFVKVDEQNLALGTLSSEKFPQISFDLVFEKKFELSHNWKNGSVYFTGYRAYALEEDESSEENFPVVPRHVGKSQVKQAAKPHGTAAKQVRIVEPNKVEDTNEDVDQDTSSDEDLSEASNEDAAKMNSEEESSEGDDSSDDEEGGEDEDEETSKMAEERKKRPIQSAQKTPADKKAKLITPQRIEGKKFGGRVATPYPSKQAGTKEQTPKSGGAYPCKSCNSLKDTLQVDELGSVAEYRGHVWPSSFRPLDIYQKPLSVGTDGYKAPGDPAMLRQHTHQILHKCPAENGSQPVYKYHCKLPKKGEA